MTVGIFAAKQKLSELVGRAARGEEIIITRCGKEQARLVPIPAARERTLKEIFDSIRGRPRVKLPKGITIKSLIEEGRRF